MDLSEKAVELFSTGNNCSQALLGAFGPTMGVAESQCLAISSGFGAGICRCGGMCGAVTGALMVIGLRHESQLAKDPANKREVYAVGGQFFERFTERHGSVVCEQLLGCNIGTPEGQRIAQENDYHHTRCAHYVRTAAKIVEELLERPGA